MKQLQFLPFGIRILICVVHAWGIIMLSTLREMLCVVKILSTPNTLTNREINRIRMISFYSYLYKLHLILTIYVINALIFDSFTFFPLEWTLARIVTIIMDKSTDMFHTRISRMFHRTVTNVDFYNILYFLWVWTGLLTGFGVGVPIT